MLACQSNGQQWPTQWSFYGPHDDVTNYVCQAFSKPQQSLSQAIEAVITPNKAWILHACYRVSNHGTPCSYNGLPIDSVQTTQPHKRTRLREKNSEWLWLLRINTESQSFKINSVQCEDSRTSVRHIEGWRGSSRSQRSAWQLFAEKHTWAAEYFLSGFNYICQMHKNVVAD